MNHMLAIPKDRKRISQGRMCLLIAVAALLFLSVSAGWGQTLVEMSGLAVQ